ncbi:hypothetical protein IG631_02155 [Alternaria alternata]|nr:hypothetical protein IG631_02155 [Alternaria alternata]
MNNTSGLAGANIPNQSFTWKSQETSITGYSYSRRLQVMEKVYEAHDLYLDHIRAQDPFLRIAHPCRSRTAATLVREWSDVTS